ncbi:hypothetical protein [Mycobacterium sp.]|uniref:hypothetical protein n=1 Tax=Mycobacterium sp. TaxID=1785 RepID=UPI003BAFE423
MADDERDDPPLNVDSLASLQAGLHDDKTAARLRRKVRTDPDARQTMDALDRVRGDVAALSSAGSSAPEVDPAVVNRTRTALRAQHGVRRGGLPRSARLVVALSGLTAIAVAAWLGTRALITAPAATTSRPTTIEHITVSRPPLTIPLSDQQILAVVDREPDFGPLTDPRRRASCLSGLGYPANARVLGARPIEIAGHPAVLLVLPGDAPGGVKALAVAPTCSAANTGLSADRMVTRP